jgi:acetate CoA/acetoacetate CoA-transferase beta subunit
VNNIKEIIAERTAEELEDQSIVNLGIGIPTLVPKFLGNREVILHTENGLLGVSDVKEEEIDPNLVNAGKLPVGETEGSSFFNSSDSFGMIRGGHVDVSILGVLQVDEQGLIANWAIPGKNIIGVGGAMDLLVGSKKVIITTMHTSKDGSSKIVPECTYPITSIRSVDLIVTDLAVFEVRDKHLFCVEIMPGSSKQEIKEKTEANFTFDLKS